MDGWVLPVGGPKPVHPEQEELPMPKVYVFTAHGGPEVESFAGLPRPVPGPGQLLIAAAR